MFNTVSVGRRIAELRKGKDMTQMEVADLMGVSYQAVSNWERGNSMPDISKLGDLAAALDVSIDALIGNEPSINLAKHILTGDEKNYIRDEKVELDDLAEIAPLLKPTQTNDIFDAISNKRAVPVTLSELAPLAPFMGSKFLDHIIQNVDVHNISELTDIAPFISREVLDDLARKALSEGKLSELTDIAPFISGEVLAEIAQNEFKKGTLKDLVHLAPFLPKQVLHDIAEKSIRENGIDSIGPITPFL